MSYYKNKYTEPYIYTVISTYIDREIDSLQDFFMSYCQTYENQRGFIVRAFDCEAILSRLNCYIIDYD